MQLEQSTMQTMQQRYNEVCNQKGSTTIYIYAIQYSLQSASVIYIARAPTKAKAKEYAQQAKAKELAQITQSKAKQTTIQRK